jgi:hypothetical protein
MKLLSFNLQEKKKNGKESQEEVTHSTKVFV